MSGLALSRVGDRARGDAVSTRRLHCCNGLDPRRDGGMVPSILGMTGSLARRGEPITIVTPTPSRLDGSSVPEGVELLGPEVDFEALIRRAEVVHFHGLWQRHTRRGARAARLANVPYLVAAHGMAEPWALRHKALKKKVYTALVEGKNLRRASCLHALSRPEIGHLRAIAPRTPVALIPNGVDLRPFDDLPSRASLEAEFPELQGKLVVLFFGRLHVKKGLDLLADAMATLKDDHPEIHVLLAGNDDGALAPFLWRVEAAGLAGRITHLGHVSGERARQAWAAADAFVLPSYSEGFSMAILEALAARLPALITTACHFPELDRAGGAVVVEPTAEAVTAGLRSLVERSPGERADLANRGRTLVESRYTWDRQAERLAEVYDWVSGGGPAPEAVEDARSQGETER
jgi:glycosyltransferase involved in cell wall biosynthesis